MARKCAFLDIDATAFKKLILSNVGSEEGGGARCAGFPNAADKEDLYAKVRIRFQFHHTLHNFFIVSMTDLHKAGKMVQIYAIFWQVQLIFKTLHIITDLN